MQHRRLRLRSASQGSAPAPAAQRHSGRLRRKTRSTCRGCIRGTPSPLLTKLIMEVPEKSAPISAIFEQGFYRQ